jgi:hypothetical protein
MPAARRYDLIFSSDRFNLSEPQDYFINDCCYGDDVAKWLADQLRQRGIEVTEPDQEDWGWYFEARYDESAYFVGVGGTPDDESPPSRNSGHWRLIVEKHRSFMERLRQSNLFDADDPFLKLLQEVLSVEAGLVFEGIE